MSAKKPEQPDWFNDIDLQPKDDFVSFKNENIHFIAFLNEGKKGTSKIALDDGSDKIVPCVHYRVLENDTEKDFKPIAKNFIGALKELFPLSNRTFRIELIRGKKDVENKYTIQELK